MSERESEERTSDAQAPESPWLEACVAALLFALAMFYFSFTWGRTLDLRDEGYLLSRAMRVAAGDWPHRDFIDVYGPLGLYVSGQILRVADGEIIALRIAVAVLKGVAVVTTYLIARHFVPRLFAVLAAGVAIVFWGRLAANLNTPYAALLSLVLLELATLGVLRGLVTGRRRAFIVAGVAAGLAMLGKQSLGIMVFYGLCLALWGIGLLEPAEPRARRGVVISSVGVWWIGGLAVLYPVLPFLGLRDYLLHFALLHVCMFVLGVGVLRGVGGGDPLRGLGARFVPFVAGAVLVLIPVALLYAVWGALGQMLVDMFLLPRGYRNYAVPVVLPTLRAALLAFGTLGLISGALFWLGARRRAAALHAAWGALALLVGGLAVSSPFGGIGCERFRVPVQPRFLRGRGGASPAGRGSAGLLARAAAAWPASGGGGGAARHASALLQFHAGLPGLPESCAEPLDPARRAPPPAGPRGLGLGAVR